ncbi:MAG: sensor domain-containing diguanylate cyclase, partial [Acidisphaera sp.]|nr:sensor domain-containing diguanylate cyclase [Acidisphaera sp.]
MAHAAERHARNIPPQGAGWLACERPAVGGRCHSVRLWSEGGDCSLPPARLLPDEDDRLAALRALEILDTQSSPEFDIFPELARHIFDTPMAAISLVESERQWFKASVGLDVEETTRDISFCAHAILEPDRVLCVQDAAKDPRFADNPLVTGAFGVRFYAGAPIKSPCGQPIGAVCVIDRQPRQASGEALASLQRIAVGVESALRLHASVRHLQNEAITDRLTGLRNRAGLDAALVAALSDRRRGKVGMLFLDLDGFKAVNDLFGHACGDEILQQVGNRLKRMSRGDDAVCRFGGDEFCLLACGIQDVNDLTGIAQRIHDSFREPFRVGDQAINLRTSIGIAVYPDDTSNSAELVRLADAALYDA